MQAPDFDAFFRAATGGDHDPYEYQRALASTEQPPSLLDVPTGSGKTLALIVSWLYHRRVLGLGPRRLVYALPMRTLVEQTASVAEQVRTNLGREFDDLRIHVLMGGATRPRDDWRRYPDEDQLIVGTIDMLLSRALNRGYASSRFGWPVSFGLLNSDCRWVFDEVQLMGPARVTSAQLDGLRSKLGVARPCETMWVSATLHPEALSTIDRPDIGKSLTLSVQDRHGPLRKRLEAEKVVERLDLTSATNAELARAIAAAIVERHRAGTRSIVVLNRVDLAQRVTAALDRVAADVEVVLLHSRFRPPERSRHMERALAPVGTGPGRIVVATQVIEAGVDVTSALLATETAPFSSIVQRVGRCNRAGHDDKARVLWLDRGLLDARAAAPYEPEDVEAARAAMLELVGTSASPARLARLDVPTRRESWSVLRRRHLLDLFDTSPDLSGLDVDVSRFIREDDERTVSVFFRDEPAPDAPLPEQQELVEVPIGSLGDRRTWIHDHVSGVAVPVGGRAIRPGATVMLDAAEGGYDDRIGWSPGARNPVTAVRHDAAAEADAIDRDPESAASRWVELSEHLDQAATCARDLLERLGSLDLRPVDGEAVVAAAALHDVGKAHEVFQERLLATAQTDEEREERRGTLWAKSERAGGRPRDGRHLRHELASALAVLQLDGSIELPRGGEDLVRYLIAAHHGKVRLIVRAAPEEQPPPGTSRETRIVLGVMSGESVPAVSTPLGTLNEVVLDLDRIDAIPSWTERACALRDDPQLGPFRLAFLEALVRVADWRASDA